MDRKTFESQRAFAGNRKPSMLRRRIDHDYQGRCIYLITLVTEGRRPLFGRLEGRSDAEKGSPDSPHIVLNELGKAVQRNFHSIGDRHPEIRVLALQMMPDHLHGIVFVRERMDKHLGQAISGFKAGCNKDYRHIVLGRETPCVVAMPQQTEHTQQTEQPPQQTERPRPPRSSYDREHGLLFASGYNDRILLREGLTAGSIISPITRGACWPSGSTLTCSECSSACASQDKIMPPSATASCSIIP